MSHIVETERLFHQATATRADLRNVQYPGVAKQAATTQLALAFARECGISRGYREGALTVETGRGAAIVLGQPLA